MQNKKKKLHYNGIFGCCFLKDMEYNFGEIFLNLQEEKENRGKLQMRTMISLEIFRFWNQMYMTRVTVKGNFSRVVQS